MIRKLVRLLMLALLAPLIYSFAQEAYLFFISKVEFADTKWFLLGFLLYIPTHRLIARERIAVLEDFKHELAHTVVGCMFLRGTRKFIVNPKPEPMGSVIEEGSQVVFDTSGSPNFLIYLAPYYFPTFTIPLLIAEPIAFYPLHEVIDFLIGFTLALHYLSVLRQFRLIQTDITRVGVIFSVVVTCILNIIILVITLCVVSSEYSNILHYLELSLTRTLESYKTTYQTLMLPNELSIPSDGASSLWKIAAG